jgi:hypothetical protein
MRQAKTNTTSKYRVTLVPLESLHLITQERDIPGVEAPRYNAERDEPAFQAVWQQVAEMRAHGKVAPIPPATPGGIRLRGSRTKSDD